VTRKTKDEILQHYATKEPKRFVEYDAFDWPDSSDFFGHYIWPTVSDPGPEAGPCLASRVTWELMRGAQVRVLIDPEADRDTICRLLRRVLIDIEDGGMEMLGDAGKLSEEESRLLDNEPFPL
jgi:hypothetical protein